MHDPGVVLGSCKGDAQAQRSLVRRLCRGCCIALTRWVYSDCNDFGRTIGSVLLRLRTGVEHSPKAVAAEHGDDCCCVHLGEWSCRFLSAAPSGSNANNIQQEFVTARVCANALRQSYCILFSTD